MARTKRDVIEKQRQKEREAVAREIHNLEKKGSDSQVGGYETLPSDKETARSAKILKSPICSPKPKHTARKSVRDSEIVKTVIEIEDDVDAEPEQICLEWNSSLPQESYADNPTNSTLSEKPRIRLCIRQKYCSRNRSIQELGSQSLRCLPRKCASGNKIPVEADLVKKSTKPSIFPSPAEACRKLSVCRGEKVALVCLSDLFISPRKSMKRSRSPRQSGAGTPTPSSPRNVSPKTPPSSRNISPRPTRSAKSSPSNEQKVQEEHVELRSRPLQKSPIVSDSKAQSVSPNDPKSTLVHKSPQSRTSPRKSSPSPSSSSSQPPSISSPKVQPTKISFKITPKKTKSLELLRIPKGQFSLDFEQSKPSPSSSSKGTPESGSSPQKRLRSPSVRYAEDMILFPWDSPRKRSPSKPPEANEDNFLAVVEKQDATEKTSTKHTDSLCKKDSIPDKTPVPQPTPSDTSSVVRALDFDAKTKPSPIADTKTKPSPIADTKTKPSPIADTKTKLSPIADTKTKLSPVADTKTKPSPIADTKTKLSPIADTKTKKVPISKKLTKSKAARNSCPEAGKSKIALKPDETEKSSEDSEPEPVASTSKTTGSCSLLFMSSEQKRIALSSLIARVNKNLKSTNKLTEIFGSNQGNVYGEDNDTDGSEHQSDDEEKDSKTDKSGKGDYSQDKSGKGDYSQDKSGKGDYQETADVGETAKSVVKRHDSSDESKETKTVEEARSEFSLEKDFNSNNNWSQESVEMSPVKLKKDKVFKTLSASTSAYVESAKKDLTEPDEKHTSVSSKSISSSSDEHGSAGRLGVQELSKLESKISDHSDDERKTRNIFDLFSLDSPSHGDGTASDTLEMLSEDKIKSEHLVEEEEIPCKVSGRAEDVESEASSSKDITQEYETVCDKEEISAKLSPVSKTASKHDTLGPLTGSSKKLPLLQTELKSPSTSPMKSNSVTKSPQKKSDVKSIVASKSPGKSKNTGKDLIKSPLKAKFKESPGRPKTPLGHSSPSRSHLKSDRAESHSPRLKSPAKSRTPDLKRERGDKAEISQRSLKNENVKDELETIQIKSEPEDIKPSTTSSIYRYRALHKFKPHRKILEPKPLSVLKDMEKSCNDKTSVFVCKELDQYLKRNKRLFRQEFGMKVEGCEEGTDDCHESPVKEEIQSCSGEGCEPGKLKSEQTMEVDLSSPRKDSDQASPRKDKIGNLDLGPDFDEIDGLLFMSFSAEQGLNAHIEVEKKLNSAEEAEALLEMCRFKTLKEKAKAKGVSVLKDVKNKDEVKQNLRGVHKKVGKYQRLFRKELEEILMIQETRIPEKLRTRTPEKTTDITKIKGWKKKFANREEFERATGLHFTESGKLHWRTEQRILKKLKPGDAKEIGLKKKRRKLVVFAKKKGMSRGDHHKDHQKKSKKERDHKQGMYDGELWDGQEGGEDGSSSVPGHIPHKIKFPSQYKYDKRKRFVKTMGLSAEEEQILKKLGTQHNYIRENKENKDSSIVKEEDSETVAVPKTRSKKAKQQSTSLPLIKVTQSMALAAVSALDRKLLARSRQIAKQKEKKEEARKKAEDAAKAKKRAEDAEKGLEEEEDEAGKGEGEGVDESSSLQSGAGNVCDKPGCRYGCICHLCNFSENEEKSPPKPSMCDKEYCRLGCICDSIERKVETRGSKRGSHCGKTGCMFGCKCKPKKTVSRPDTPVLSPQDVAAEKSSKSDSQLNKSSSEADIPDLTAKEEEEAKKKETKVSHKKRKGSSKKGIPKVAKSQKKDKEWTPTGEMNAKSVSDEPARKKQRREDIYAALPRRESTYRLAKNLDAISRKAMIYYESSEMYTEATTRVRRRKSDPVEFETLKNSVDLTSSPTATESTSEQATTSQQVTRESPTMPQEEAKQEVISLVDEDSEEESITSQPTLNPETGKFEEFGKDSDAEEDPDDDGNITCARTTIYTPKPRPVKKVPEEPETIDLDSDKETKDEEDKKKEVKSFVAKSQSKSVKKVKEGPATAAEKLGLTTPKNQPAPIVIPDDDDEPKWRTQMVCLKAKKKQDASADSANQECEIKLLEIISDCKWEEERTNILSKISHTIAKQDYPKCQVVMWGGYYLEFLPKSDKPASIPPELKSKLPNAMFSIRVRVTLTKPSMPVTKPRELTPEEEANLTPEEKFDYQMDKNTQRLLEKIQFAQTLQKIIEKEESKGHTPQNFTVSRDSIEKALVRYRTQLLNLKRMNKERKALALSKVPTTVPPSVFLQNSTSSADGKAAPPTGVTLKQGAQLGSNINLGGAIKSPVIARIEANQGVTITRNITQSKLPPFVHFPSGDTKTGGKSNMIFVPIGSNTNSALCVTRTTATVSMIPSLGATTVAGIPSVVSPSAVRNTAIPTSIPQYRLVSSFPSSSTSISQSIPVQSKIMNIDPTCKSVLAPIPSGSKISELASILCDNSSGTATPTISAESQVGVTSSCTVSLPSALSPIFRPLVMAPGQRVTTPSTLPSSVYPVIMAPGQSSTTTATTVSVTLTPLQKSQIPSTAVTTTQTSAACPTTALTTVTSTSTVILDSGSHSPGLAAGTKGSGASSTTAELSQAASMSTDTLTVASSPMKTCSRVAPSSLRGSPLKDRLVNLLAEEAVTSSVNSSHEDTAIEKAKSKALSLEVVDDCQEEDEEKMDISDTYTSVDGVPEIKRNKACVSPNSTNETPKMSDSATIEVKPVKIFPPTSASSHTSTPQGDYSSKAKKDPVKIDSLKKAVDQDSTLPPVSTSVEKSSADPTSKEKMVTLFFPASQGSAVSSTSFNPVLQSSMSQPLTNFRVMQAQPGMAQAGMITLIPVTGPPGTTSLPLGAKAMPAVPVVRPGQPQPEFIAVPIHLKPVTSSKSGSVSSPATGAVNGKNVVAQPVPQLAVSTTSGVPTSVGQICFLNQQQLRYPVGIRPAGKVPDIHVTAANTTAATRPLLQMPTTGFAQLNSIQQTQGKQFIALKPRLGATSTTSPNQTLTAQIVYAKIPTNETSSTKDGAEESKETKPKGKKRRRKSKDCEEIDSKEQDGEKKKRKRKKTKNIEDEADSNSVSPTDGILNISSEKSDQKSNENVLGENPVESESSVPSILTPEGVQSWRVQKVPSVDEEIGQLTKGMDSTDAHSNENSEGKRSGSVLSEEMIEDLLQRAESRGAIVGDGSIRQEHKTEQTQEGSEVQPGAEVERKSPEEAIDPDSFLNKIGKSVDSLLESTKSASYTSSIVSEKGEATEKSSESGISLNKDSAEFSAGDSGNSDSNCSSTTHEYDLKSSENVSESSVGNTADELLSQSNSSGSGGESPVNDLIVHAMTAGMQVASALGSPLDKGCSGSSRRTSCETQELAGEKHGGVLTCTENKCCKSGTGCGEGHCCEEEVREDKFCGSDGETQASSVSDTLEGNVCAKNVDSKSLDKHNNLETSLAMKDFSEQKAEVVTVHKQLSLESSSKDIANVKSDDIANDDSEKENFQDDSADTGSVNKVQSRKVLNCDKDIDSVEKSLPSKIKTAVDSDEVDDSDDPDALSVMEDEGNYGKNKSPASLKEGDNSNGELSRKRKSSESDIEDCSVKKSCPMSQDGKSDSQTPNRNLKKEADDFKVGEDNSEDDPVVVEDDDDDDDDDDYFIDIEDSDDSDIDIETVDELDFSIDRTTQLLASACGVHSSPATASKSKRKSALQPIRNQGADKIEFKEGLVKMSKEEMALSRRQLQKLPEQENLEKRKSSEKQRRMDLRLTFHELQEVLLEDNHGENESVQILPKSQILGMAVDMVAELRLQNRQFFDEVKQLTYKQASLKEELKKMKESFVASSGVPGAVINNFLKSVAKAVSTESVLTDKAPVLESVNKSKVEVKSNCSSNTSSKQSHSKTVKAANSCEQTDKKKAPSVGGRSDGRKAANILSKSASKQRPFAPNEKPVVPSKGKSKPEIYIDHAEDDIDMDAIENPLNSNGGIQSVSKAGSLKQKPLNGEDLLPHKGKVLESNILQSTSQSTKLLQSVPQAANLNSNVSLKPPAISTAKRVVSNTISPSKMTVPTRVVKLVGNQAAAGDKTVTFVLAKSVKQGGTMVINALPKSVQPRLLVRNITQGEPATVTIPNTAANSTKPMDSISSSVMQQTTTNSAYRRIVVNSNQQIVGRVPVNPVRVPVTPVDQEQEQAGGAMDVHDSDEDEVMSSTGDLLMDEGIDEVDGDMPVSNETGDATNRGMYNNSSARKSALNEVIVIEDSSTGVKKEVLSMDELLDQCPGGTE